MKKIILGLLRGFFRVAGRIAPDFTARRAYGLFCRPIGKKRLTDKQRQILDTSTRHAIRVNGDEVRVYVWRRSDTTRSDRAVLLTHGWGSAAGRLAVWVQPMLDAGFDVIALDAPAHGESGGSKTTLPLYVAAIKATAEEKGPVQAIIGHSFGGMCAAMAVAGADVVGTPDLPVSHAVIIAAPNSTAEVIGRFGRFMGMNGNVVAGINRHIEQLENKPIEAYSTAAVLVNARPAVMVVHDTEDRDVPVGDGEATAAANPQIRFLKTTGLGHHRVARDSKIIAEVTRFVTSH